MADVPMIAAEQLELSEAELALLPNELSLARLTCFVLTLTADQRPAAVPILLLLVASRDEPNEQAVYLVRKCGGEAVVEASIPVFADTKLLQSAPVEVAQACIPDAVMTLSITGTVYTAGGHNSDDVMVHLDAKGADDCSIFLMRLAESISFADKEMYKSHGFTHDWVRFMTRRRGSAISVRRPRGHHQGAAARGVPSGGPSGNDLIDLGESRHVGGPAADPADADDSDALIETFLGRQNYDYTPTDMISLKEDWIKSQLAVRESEFTNLKKITVCIGSYNVNGRYPREDNGEMMDLRPWVHFPAAECPDVIVLGFQELDLTKEAFIFNDSTREEDWSRAIEAGLNKEVKYRKVKSRQLVGMLMIVYAKESLMPVIRHAHSDSQGTGIMGMMGNKGGVSIRFQIYDSTICFVNSHLAAHDDEVKRRNQDHHEICRRTQFYRESNPLSIFDHDHLFWLGDLNYRINLSDPEVKHFVAQKNYIELLKADQLLEQRRAGLAFSGFEEGNITFAPTYKFDPGTDTFDTSEKQRTPAYCDRIMFYRRDEGLISQRAYESIPECRVSDHKPVRALYDVQAKVIDAAKQREVYQSIVRQLDVIENKSLPDITITANLFEYENVRYWRPITRTFVVENVGQVTAKFKFIPKLDENDAHKPWLLIEPMGGLLLPGKKVTVSMTVMPDHRSARQLNNGEEKIEDILILHLENGKDYFLTISGSYGRTCMCTLLDDLVYAIEPVRTIPIGPIKKNDYLGPPDGEHRLYIPKELWIMVDYLYHNALDTPTLFMEIGSRKAQAFILEKIDCGVPLEPGLDVHAVAALLITFLDNLPEAVIPVHLYKRCVECCGSVILCQQIVNELSITHHAVFIYIMAFLRELLQRQSSMTVEESNQITKGKLALLFGSTLLRPPTSGLRKNSSAQALISRGEISLQQKQAAFIAHFLEESPL